MNYSVNLKDLPIFKKIIVDYLLKDKRIEGFSEELPSKEKIESMMEMKFRSAEIRKSLSSSILSDYSEREVSQLVIDNINLLSDSRTFTITTGHQLNLFTGPLYFILKIAQTIKLSSQLKQLYPGYSFIPVYWMATEDHDLEEINHINLFNQKREWQTSQKGATGRMNTQGIDALGDNLKGLFENSPATKNLVGQITEIYNASQTLAEATRGMVHLLFPKEGIVVMDADKSELKKHFIPLLLKELKESAVFEKMNRTNEELKGLGYHAQVNPREINLFYLKESSRNRIVREKDKWSELNGEQTWNWEELELEVNDFPERFSPNAAFRPLYQEFILPNLMTVGGPGEIAYWLQLKSVFKEFKVDFPFLQLRNSHLFLSKKQTDLLDEFSLITNDLLTRKEELLKSVAGELVKVDLKDDSKYIISKLEDLTRKVINEDSALEGKMLSVKKVLENSLNQIQSKLEKSVKSKNSNKFSQLEKLHDSVTPGGKLNERTINFFNLLNHINLDDFIEEISILEDDFTPKLYVHSY
jgi:bacillithiol biosynthesis cysteine-adding enzyme BshC